LGHFFFLQNWKSSNFMQIKMRGVFADINRPYSWERKFSFSTHTWGCTATIWWGVCLTDLGCKPVRFDIRCQPETNCITDPSPQSPWVSWGPVMNFTIVGTFFKLKHVFIGGFCHLLFLFELHWSIVLYFAFGLLVLLYLSFHFFRRAGY
jgi:hypothetical protein